MADREGHAVAVGAARQGSIRVAKLHMSSMQPQWKRAKEREKEEERGKETHRTAVVSGRVRERRARVTRVVDVLPRGGQDTTLGSAGPVASDIDKESEEGKIK
jgi:hypothetical protein